MPLEVSGMFFLAWKGKLGVCVSSNLCLVEGLHLIPQIFSETRSSLPQTLYQITLPALYLLQNTLLPALH